MTTVPGRDHTPAQLSPLAEGHSGNASVSLSSQQSRERKRPVWEQVVWRFVVCVNLPAHVNVCMCVYLYGMGVEEAGWGGIFLIFVSSRAFFNGFGCIWHLK